MPHSILELKEKYKHLGVKSGRGRLLLLAMAERIEMEEGDGPHPKPKNAIERALYEFVKLCQSGDIQYIKELLDRLDGKSVQAVNIGDADGEKLAVNIIRFSDLPLIGESSTIASQSPKRLDS